VGGGTDQPPAWGWDSLTRPHPGPHSLRPRWVRHRRCPTPPSDAWALHRTPSDAWALHRTLLGHSPKRQNGALRETETETETESERDRQDRDRDRETRVVPCKCARDLTCGILWGILCDSIGIVLGFYRGFSLILGDSIRDYMKFYMDFFIILWDSIGDSSRITEGVEYPQDLPQNNILVRCRRSQNHRGVRG